MRKFFKWSMGVLVVLLALLWLNLPAVIQSFVLQPVKLESNYTFNLNYPFEEITIITPDNARLFGIWMPVENAKATILYFHGNRDNLVRWAEIAHQYTRYQTNVLVIDYRGYGKSTGKVTEENLLKDALLWYDKAKALDKSDDIILFGRSLGTGFANYLANERKTLGLILETPYTSMVDVIGSHVPLFIADRSPIKLKTSEYLSKINTPSIIFHGTSDEVIPYEIGNNVYGLMNKKNATFITLPGGGHNNLGTYDKYWKSLDDWMETLLKQKDANDGIEVEL